MKVTFSKESIKNLFRRISHFNLVFIPTDPYLSTKSLKVSSFKVLIFLLIYSFTIFLAGFYIITLLNLDTLLIPKSYIESRNKKEIIELNEKILNLAKEVEELQITNIKLKKIFEKQDSLNQKIKNQDSIKSKIQGNVFHIIKKTLFDLFSSISNEIIFLKPVEGILSNKFNPDKGHFGVDFSAKENTPILASANGYISFAGFTPDYGYEIIIIHSNDFITKYKHCSVIIKNTGQRVIQGELIGLVGNTGLKSHGSHLHFEIWHKGKPVNPEKYLLNF
ncbi:MAG: M23 family metallopeptidase [Ignavibacterium sp.]|nr:M23 family metallopeptidase [Ignavibacterium sp.]MDW8375536.1 M23 family metallopeptidase [Ignavibacteriales bacterium]